MKFHEFVLTILAAVSITVIVLEWALIENRLCAYTPAPNRIQRCVIVVTR